MARKAITAEEQPRGGQLLSMTLLIMLAWLPLIPLVEPNVSVYVAFLLALRLVSLRWSVLTPGRWLLLPLTLVGIANAFIAYRTFFAYEGGTALLVTMLALKLLETKRVRDIRFACILFGFLLVSQFLFDESLSRALYLGFLLVLDFALMADLTTRLGKGRRALISAVQRAGVYTWQALPLVVALFVLFPRLSEPLWNIPVPTDRGQTGMSDWMEPGSVSELVRSPEPAFRVRFDGRVPAANDLYWRGPIAWHTDGHRWTGWAQDVPLGEAAALIEAGHPISYQIELEPTGEKWLYALDLPVEVPTDAQILGDFRVILDKRVTEVRHFSMTSALRYNSGGLNLDQELAGTQLPDNVTDRMRDLVADWQRDHDDPAEIVNKALRFINREPFYYTLAPPALGSNPLDNFLFETRKGFCEHYAGAFTLLMRIAGIPSRVVLGYLGGQYNPLGKYLLIRQSDAHAWVEVWLSGKGWVRVDPTAAVAPERIETSHMFDELGNRVPSRFFLGDMGIVTRWMHNFGLLTDAVKTGWRNWVMGLTSERQQEMLERLGLGHLREYGLVAALMVSSGVILALLLTALTRPAGPRDALERIYARFCRRLAQIGLPRGRGEGPLDYSNRVIAARPDLGQPIASFMELYLPLRYGAGDRKASERDLLQRLAQLQPRRRPLPR